MQVAFPLQVIRFALDDYPWLNGGNGVLVKIRHGFNLLVKLVLGCNPVYKANLPSALNVETFSGQEVSASPQPHR